MRRKNGGIGVFAVLIMLTAALLTGCEKGSGLLPQKNPELDKPFESEVSVQAGELEFKGNIKRYGTGIWNMTVTAPETLAGMNLNYNADDGVTAELGALKLDIPAENIKDTAVFSLIFKAVDSAAAGTISCTDTEDGKVFTGENAFGTYSLTFDPERLTLTGIQIPAAGVSCEVNRFKLMTGGEDTAAETTVPVETSETSAIPEAGSPRGHSLPQS